MDANNTEHILIVDDEPLIRESLCETLRLEGYHVKSAASAGDALEKINTNHIDIVISDIKMPGIDGIELLKRLKNKNRDIFVILMTAYANVETAVEAMKLGAFDYVSKPIMDNEIKITLKKISDQKKLIAENIRLKQKLAETTRSSFFNMIGASSCMQKIYTMIESIATTKATILITGESGTGKRLVALAIHQNDQTRKNNRFVEVSCGALPENLLESELFGHIKGAFTGAIKDRIGRFELADKGTVFLDEIDAFSPALQVKLLRVLQEGEFENVGDAKTIKVDTRIIAATNQNIEELIKTGKFREDLFYRLNVISIHIPPLRERKEDIPLLIEYFLQKYNKKNNAKVTGITQSAQVLLLEYGWPGNIRELENAIEHGVVITKSGEISESGLPAHILRYKKIPADKNLTALKQILNEPEKEIILSALKKCGWNRKKTAGSLNITRATLYNKIKKFNIKKQ